MRRRAALLLTPLLLAGALAGCGGGSAASKAADQAKSKGLPAVTGGYGTKPKVVLDKKAKAAKKTTSQVLVKGTGAKVGKGDLLVADYLGEIYATGKVFDNSYDRGQPAGFTIGANKVIPGWDKTLVGVPAGSRVLMTVPPVDGYGAQGNTKAGIKPTDTLVFVVDVIAGYGKGGAATSATPVPALPATLPTVAGKLGERPTIKVTKGLAPPKAPKVTVLAKGTGPAVVTNRLLVVAFEAVSWSNQAVGSTWTAGSPLGAPVGAKGQPSPFDPLVGVPAGSRVLLELPAQQGADPAKKPDPAKDSLAVVIDVIAQHGPAKGKAKP